MNTVVFHYQRGKALFFGLVALAFFAVVAASLIKALFLGELPGVASIIFVLVAFSFGISAVEYLSIFLRNPIAIQIDAQGLSVHKFDPVPWNDMKSVSALRGRKRHRYLGITLLQPEEYRANLTAIAKLRSKVWHWRYTQDIVVEGFLLKTNEVEVIAQATADFRTANGL